MQWLSKAVSTLTCSLVIGFAGSAEALPDEAAAVVGERTISSSTFQNLLARLRKEGDMRVMLETVTPEGRERILNGLVEQTLLALEARDRGLPGDEAVRRAMESSVDRVLAQAVSQREVASLSLDDATLDEYYTAHLDEFTTGKRVKARQINTRTRKEAEQAVQELEQGRDFGAVATERNIDSSKKQGGELGWVRSGVMVKPFQDALFALDVGQMSEIVETSFGFHIIQVEEIDTGTARPFEAVKDEIRQQIIDQHMVRLKQELKAKYPVRINKELLAEGDY
jgi:peptidyl-prolyl cis-trans isomerase C